MTTLKSRIDCNGSYAKQNSACQIVGWKAKAADPTFQCCSLQDLKNIKNVKRCRDSVPKNMQTR